MCTFLTPECLVAVSMEPIVKLFDLRLEGRKEVVEYAGHERSVTSVATSPS